MKTLFLSLLVTGAGCGGSTSLSTSAASTTSSSSGAAITTSTSTTTTTSTSTSTSASTSTSNTTSTTTTTSTSTGTSSGSTTSTTSSNSTSGTTSGTFDAGTATYFIATNGIDQIPGGTEANPWATLPYAQTQLRPLVGTEPLTVVLRDGIYYLPTALAFTAQDSGDAGATVTWEAYPGETPVLSGGTPISGWANDGGNLWLASLPTTTQPFEMLFYNGERRLRPRLGTPGVTNDAGAYLGNFLRVVDEIDSPTMTTACPVQIDAGVFKCYDRVKFDPASGISSTWTNLNPPAGNPCGITSTSSAPVGDIEVDYFEAWTMEQLRVSCVDDANSILYFTSPMRAVPTQLPFFGPAKGHRFVVENVQSALTQPGQWFLDRSKTPWLLSYLANPGENPSTDTVVAPQIAPPILSATNLASVNFTGLTFEMDNYVPGPNGFIDDGNGEDNLPAAIDCESCQNVTFDAITSRHTSTSGIQVGSVSAKSGPPANNVTVQSSFFYDVGDCGVHLGTTPNGADTQASLPQNLTVQNNLIQGYSRVFADGEGIGTGSIHDVVLSHNDITDGYHAGISVCELGCPAKNGNGGANVQSLYNRIWNVLQGLTSDGGTLYYNIGNAIRSALGAVIKHNVIHDVTDSSIIDTGVAGSGYGGHGIYLDIQTAGADLEDNVIYRVASSAVFNPNGAAPGMPPNLIQNNILAFGRKSSFEQDKPWPQDCCASWDGGCPTAPPVRANLTSNIFFFDKGSPTVGCAYSCGLPYDEFLDFQANLYWRTDGTFSTDPKGFHVGAKTPGNVPECYGADTAADWYFMDLTQWQGAPTLDGGVFTMDEDQQGAIQNPGFADAGFPADDYSLASSPLAGFDQTLTNDTLLHAGRVAPTFTPPPVPETFPTYAYDAGAF